MIYAGLPYTLRINKRNKLAIFEKGRVSNGDLDRVLNAVAEVTKITVDQIKSKDRTLDTKIARFIYCYLAREMDLDTVVRIGKKVYRHHATIIHGHNTVKNWLTYDKHLGKTIEQIKEQL